MKSNKKTKQSLRNKKADKHIKNKATKIRKKSVAKQTQKKEFNARANGQFRARHSRTKLKDNPSLAPENNLQPEVIPEQTKPENNAVSHVRQSGNRG